MIVAAYAACWALPLFAEHAKVSLDVIAPKDQVTAFVDQTPPDWGKNPRPVLEAKVNDPLKIEWMFTNLYPHKTIEDVVVHCYVARIGAVAQREAPDLEAEEVLVFQAAFDMDFQPGGKAGGRARLKIDRPGVYLVRVESRQTQSDHEHFAAVDLVIK